MPVDKFGRSEKQKSTQQATHNTHTIRVTDFNKAEDLLLNIAEDDSRVMGCDDLVDGKTFSIKLGDDDNLLTYEKDKGIVLRMKRAFTIEETNRRGRNKPVFKFGSENVLLADLNCKSQYAIKNLPNPVDDYDAATKKFVLDSLSKAYVKYGKLPNEPMVNIVLLRSAEFRPHTITLSMYVERESGVWFDVNSSTFRNSFQDFDIFIQDTTLFCKFKKVDSGWTMAYTLYHLDRHVI